MISQPSLRPCHGSWIDISFILHNQHCTKLFNISDLYFFEIPFVIVLFFMFNQSHRAGDRWLCVQMSWVFEAAYYWLVLSYWVHTKRWNWRVKSFKNWNFFRISCIASHTDSDSHCRYCIENIVCISKGIKSLPFKTKAKLFWLNWTNSLKSFEIDLVLVFISFCSNQLSLIFCSTIL